MNPPSFRRPRAIPTLLGLGLVAASTLGLTSIATPAIAAEAPVQIVLAPSGGGVLQPGADLTITAALTNTGQSALDGGTLNVALDREVIDTRAGASLSLPPQPARTENTASDNKERFFMLTGLGLKKRQV